MLRPVWLTGCRLSLPSVSSQYIAAAIVAGDMEFSIVPCDMFGLPKITPNLRTSVFIPDYLNPRRMCCTRGVDRLRIVGPCVPTGIVHYRGIPRDCSPPCSRMDRRDVMHAQVIGFGFGIRRTTTEDGHDEISGCCFVCVIEQMRDLSVLRSIQ